MSVSLKLTWDATVDVAYLSLRRTGPAELLAQAERTDGRSVSDRLGECILRGSRDAIALGGSRRCN